MLLLTGCSGSGSRYPALINNNQQTLMMAPLVISDGGAAPDHRSRAVTRLAY